MSLTLQVVTREQQIGEIRQAWSELAPTPMQSPEWMLGWWLAYKSSNMQLNILVARDQAGAVVSLLPFYHHDSWSKGSALRFLASQHACSDYQTVLARPEHKLDAIDLFGDWLADSAGRGEWGYCEMDGVSEADKSIGKLCNFLHRHDVLLRSKQIEKTWVVDTSKGWSQCLANMSKTQRKQSRNLLNRLDKSDTMEITEHTDASEMPRATRELIELHQARWTTAGKAGCFADEKFSKFLLASCQALSLRGNCTIRTLRVDGKAAASHILLHDKNRYYMYQAGRDPRLDSMRVGRILNLQTIRMLSERGAECMDFLRGDEIYKSRLAGQPIALYRLRMVAPDARHRLQDASSTVGRNVKRTAEILSATSGSGVRNVANIPVTK
ncbi:MAG: hypothetical protein Aurels2KO_35440 [Aureliella sp.]